MSSSRRTAPLRAAFGLLGEDARDGLRRLLGPAATDHWKIPVVVDLRRPLPGLPTPPPRRLTLAQTGLGLKIQLELPLGDAGRDVRPRTELARALLLEIAYRDAPGLPAGRPYLLPPAWLVEGVATYLDARADDTGALADGLVELLGSPRVALPLNDFLVRGPDDLDSPSRRLYHAYAYGLLRLVTEELPGGRDALLGLLRALPGDVGTADPGPAPLLARLLPDGAGHDPAATERWWTAARARFAEVQRSTAVLSVEETERRLAALLFVTLPGDPTPMGPKAKKAAPSAPPAGPPATPSQVVPLEEFVARRREEKDTGGNHARRAVLAPARAGLVGLLGRAHPFYRPIVAGYEATLAVLAGGGADARRTGQRLRTLAAERATARARSEAIADYLNWFEATQRSQPSDAFEGYFQAARQSAADEHRPAHHRADPISVYLDAVEAEF